VRWPQIAVAVLFIVAYATIVWIEVIDLSKSTPRALVTIAAYSVVLLVMVVLLDKGGFW
jgi:hypothetical protein